MAVQRSHPLAALQTLARERPAAESCDLCGAAVPPGHEHLVDPGRRALACACGACAILFSARGASGGSGPAESTGWKRVPRRSERLTDLRLDDGLWQSFQIPVDIAFFYRSSAAGRVVAAYPSPAGPTESLLGLEAWSDLLDRNPRLAGLEDDVEALLLNRVAGARDGYRVSIDRCYELVGLMRLHWRGFAGGEAVWSEIRRFFAELAVGSAGPHA